jgi:hypothetical protein
MTVFNVYITGFRGAGFGGRIASFMRLSKETLSNK